MSRERYSDWFLNGLSLLPVFCSALSSLIVFPSNCRGKTGFAIAINLMYGMASLSSTFALLLVTESSIKSKHVQQVSGVYLSNFWFSALLWDLVNFLLPCLLMLVGGASEDDYRVYLLDQRPMRFLRVRWCSRRSEWRLLWTATTS